jgi:hypothetical protein
MSAQLGKEAEEDAETYETMACWCETGDKYKTHLKTTTIKLPRDSSHFLLYGLLTHTTT